MKHRDSIAPILESIIIADAFASPLDNHSAEHIRAVFGNITAHTDPAPALKHKLHLWKKPGLYTAISQYLILLCAVNAHNNAYNHQSVLHFLQTLGDSSCYLRHPYGLLQHINSVYDAPTAELCLFMPSLLCLQYPPTPEQTIRFALMHNKHPASCLAALFYYQLLHQIVSHNVSELSIALCESLASATVSMIQEYSNVIFECGANPLAFHEAASDLYNMITALPVENDEPTVTAHCLQFANKWSKYSITRLTVNHPFTILPLAMYHLHTTPIESIYFSTVQKGGKVSVLVPMSAAIASALYGKDAVPHILKEELINKKRIFQFTASLADNTLSMNYITEFFQNELKLTQKEKEELESKLKHIKHPKDKQKKPSADNRNGLTRHVVESWTKTDKAKWKKEKKNQKLY